MELRLHGGLRGQLRGEGGGRLHAALQRSRYDFSKFFDTIREQLVSLLRLNFVARFLYEGLQCDGLICNQLKISNSVAQGSVIGPMLSCL